MLSASLSEIRKPGGCEDLCPHRGRPVFRIWFGPPLNAPPPNFFFSKEFDHTSFNLLLGRNETTESIDLLMRFFLAGQGHGVSVDARDRVLTTID